MDLFRTDSLFRSINRRSFMKFLGYAGLSSTGLLSACDGVAARDKKKGPMDRRPVPPIDLAVPAIVETATFSLG
jgi:hypothetical protein